MLHNLDERAADGGTIRVCLDWDDEDNSCLLSVQSFLEPEPIVVRIPPDQARNAFEHPFCYV